MFIKSASISNYKSFDARQTLNFEPGFNLLLGTNNAGKTSVLDVLDLDFSLNEPHRSLNTLPVFGDQPRRPSQFEVTLSTKFSELWRIAGATKLDFPVTPDFLNTHNQAIETNRLLDFIGADGSIELTSIFGQGYEKVTIQVGEILSGSASRSDGGVSSCVVIKANPSSPEPSIQFGVRTSLNNTSAHYAQLFKSRIYRFSAQRRPSFQCGAQSSAALDREATLLPYCINHLQTNDAYGHRTLCAWVHRVFPSVKWVHAPPNSGSFDLRCLPVGPEERRDDLSISLGRMGAGIGNVIAMLYVVLTSREPQVIAIDEPNAFLHPRALRELLAILETEGKQHQFILTAHSADVLTAVNTKTISLLDFDGIATTVKQVGQKELHVLRSDLAEIGIHMSDLHAKDRVLWVEGQTEELVMPDILRWACSEIAAGTSVLRVENTGTFSKRSIPPEEVVKIYERLSTASALVPPMVCVLLDGESRDKALRGKIEASSDGKLRFLNRRMLENYLLHPSAIAATLKNLGVKTNPIDVRNLLPNVDSDLDYSDVNGASILENIFSTLSRTTHEFKKTRDVPTLVAWILENDPEFLDPLRFHLRNIFAI